MVKRKFVIFVWRNSLNCKLYWWQFDSFIFIYNIIIRFNVKGILNYNIESQLIVYGVYMIYLNKEFFYNYNI